MLALSDSSPVFPLIDVARLEGRLTQYACDFEAARPFRYVVIDDFLEPRFAKRLHDEFPSLDAMQRSVALLLRARSYDGEVARFGPPFSDYFAAIAADPFREWLCRLTGIPDLEMDPLLVGGGIHQGARGSSLHVHADHNTHPSDAARYRRINVLFYVNAGWRDAWGGELELYDDSGTRVVDQVAPAFNRCIIMDVHDRAFHGYQTLRVPQDVTRKMLAAYYYSALPSTLQTVESHPTIYGTPSISKFEALSLRVRRWLLHRISDAGGLPPRPKRTSSS
jgi:hypothetical protein